MQRTSSVPCSSTGLSVDVTRLELKSLTMIDRGRLRFVDLDPQLLLFDGAVDKLRLKMSLFVESNLTVHPVDGETIVSLIFLNEEDRCDYLLAFAGSDEGLRELHAKLTATLDRGRRPTDGESGSSAPRGKGLAVVKDLAGRFAGFLSRRRRSSQCESDAPVSSGVVVARSAESVRGPLEGECVVAPRRLPDVSFVGGESLIATSGDVQAIRRELCLRGRSADWRLLFRMSRDGTSLSTLMACVKAEKPVVLFIKGAGGERFGAHVGGGLGAARTVAQTGEVFLFRLSPEFAVWHKLPSAPTYAFCSCRELVVGGREGSLAAIWIDSDFLKGVSEPCAQFGSEALTVQRDWTVIDVEVWLVDLKTFRC